MIQRGWRNAFAILAALSVFAPAPSRAADSWERPRTTRRYLHPPMSECMFTLWNDGKVMRGANIHRHDWQVDYWKNLSADVLWVLHGADERPFDFKLAENRLPTDGTPFHGLSWRLDCGLSVRMDAFCETGTRTPACFLRLTFADEGDAEVREPIAVHLRKLQEHLAVKGSPDVYEPYETQVEPFLSVNPPGFVPAGQNAWKSASATVRAEGLPPDARWDGDGALRFAAAPRKGTPLVVTFTIAAPESSACPQDWDLARKGAERFWQEELARLNRLPMTISSDPEKLRLVQNLTVQMLQCFCHPVGSDLTLPRQGGLQRYVWPWDCKYMLSALGRIGDFGEYIEGALDFYFREYATAEGRIGPFRNNWICNTGECLYSLARYCLDTDNRAVWERHRDTAMRAFDWIRRIRSTPSANGGVPGLFPLAQATDNESTIQLWCFTDMLTLDALGTFAQAARHFGDSRAADVEAERDDLKNLLARIYGRFSEEAKDSDELRIPLTPDGDDEKFRKAGYFDTQQGYVLNMGMEYGFASTNDVLKVYRWHLRNGKADPHGLCANHPPKKNLSDRHIWYTTASDMYWHGNFLRIGHKDLADRVWSATLRYAMSAEYYVNERYRDDNPWFSPWSPNASGSGRILIMLLEREGGKPDLGPVLVREDGLLPMEPGKDRYYANGTTVVNTNGTLVVVKPKETCTLKYDWLPGLPRWRGFDEVVLHLDKAVPGGKVVLRLREENPDKPRAKRMVDFRSQWTKDVCFKMRSPADSHYYFDSLKFEFPAGSKLEPFTVLGMSGTHRVSAAEAFALDVETGDPLHVMAPGGKAVALVSNQADKSLRLKGVLQLRDFWSNGCDIAVDREMKAGETARIPLEVPDRMGIWRLSGAFQSEGSSATSTVSFAVLEPRKVTPRRPREEFRFGVNCHMRMYSGKYRELCGRALTSIGAKLVRCDLFSTAEVCREEGKYLWWPHEAILNCLERYGLSVHAIIYECPRWACWRAEPHEYKSYCAMRPGVFESYCRELSARYGKRIDYFEIGNEWDMAFDETALPDEQAIAMQREGMRGLHAGYANSICVANGWASDPYTTCRRRSGLQRKMIGENKDSFDVYAIHGHGFYDGYAAGIRQTLKFLKEKEVGKPWYSDETALSSADGKEDEAARTVWKKIAFAWSHGSIDYIWYNLRGAGFNPKHEEHGYGLFTGDFHPRATAAAFSAMSGLLGGMRFAELLSDVDSRIVGKWKGRRHGRNVDVYVGWDLSGKDAKQFVIDVGACAAELYDMMGNTKPATVENGKVEWKLSAEPGAVIVESL